MNNQSQITAIILTYNEEIHLQRCLKSLKTVCSDIIVIDSFSTDATKEIAIHNGVRFFENKWVNYATQFNWALDNCLIENEWILRIDADEYLCEDAVSNLKNNLSTVTSNISGLTLNLKRVFMGRFMKHMPEIKMLRLFRNGKGRSELRWMDEHIQISEGEIKDLNLHFADDNLNDIGWWTTKHNGYSIREAIDLLDIEFNLLGNNHITNLDKQALKKREVKLKYAKSPLFLRSFIYFIYRYFFKLGFLDGKEGFLWHFLQGWWYRTLVDAKIFEIKKACGTNTTKMKEYIFNRYNIKL